MLAGIFNTLHSCISSAKSVIEIMVYHVKPIICLEPCKIIFHSFIHSGYF